EPLHQPFSNIACAIAFLHLKVPSISIQTWIENWKCSNKEERLAQAIVEAHLYYKGNGLDAWLVYTMQNHQKAFINVLEQVDMAPTNIEQEIRQIEKMLPVKNVKDIAFDGHELVNLFPHLKKGKWIKQMLNQIEYEVVIGRLNNKKDEIKEWVLC